MRVMVIGGGIVGLCCALELERGGADVTLVERDRCGQATSRGNAGWLMPATTLPVGSPGIVAQAAKWLIQPDSPARLRPRRDTEFLRWCWQFLRYASGARYEHAVTAMLEFNRSIIPLYDALHETPGIDFEMHDDGLLLVALTREGLDRYRAQFADLTRRGYPEFADAEELDGTALRELEPALSKRVLGGMRLRASRQVRPETVSRGLYRYLKSLDVPILEDCAVRRLQRDSNGWCIETGTGPLHADGVVVAAGLWSKALLEPLGRRLPLQGARGCSITAAGEGTRPRRSIKMIEAQVALNPFSGAVRVSGTWDLAGNEAHFEQKRMDGVIRAASAYLKDWRPVNPDFQWAGLRPSTPDSLPLIGEVPGLDGLYLATGHGMFGVTYGPATGAAIRSIVLEKKVPHAVEPFQPARWLM